MASRQTKEVGYWLSFADLALALLGVLLLVLISYVILLKQSQEELDHQAADYADQKRVIDELRGELVASVSQRRGLAEMLNSEIGAEAGVEVDLLTGDVAIGPPCVSFDTSDVDLTDLGTGQQECVKRVVDRYLCSLESLDGRGMKDVALIIVEGHTDGSWNGPDPFRENLRVASDRAHALATYMIGDPAITCETGLGRPERRWAIRRRIQASGRSYGRLLDDYCSSSAIQCPPSDPNLDGRAISQRMCESQGPAGCTESELKVLESKYRVLSLRFALLGEKGANEKLQQIEDADLK